MPDAGSWPDWIGTTVAFVALIVAAVAAWATVRTNQAQSKAIELQRQALIDEREQRQREHADRRREQAERLMIWYQDGSYNFANLSDRPIFGVTIVVNLEDDPSKDEFIFCLDKSKDIPNPILPDGRVHQLPLRWHLLGGAPSIYFTDAAGVFWKIGDEYPDDFRVVHEVSRDEADRVLNNYPFYLSQEEMAEILDDPDSHRH